VSKPAAGFAASQTTGFEFRRRPLRLQSPFCLRSFRALVYASNTLPMPFLIRHSSLPLISRYNLTKLCLMNTLRRSHRNNILMENRPPDNGYELAQQVCKNLRTGHPEALMILYNRYQNFFAAFAKKRLFDDGPCNVDDILANFWIELLNGKAICNFKGQSSLQTYLTVILNRRIIDVNRKYERSRNSQFANYSQTDDISPESQHIQSPEDELIGKEQHSLILEALSQLEKTSPRDANLIRMHLEGMTYEEMAKAETRHENCDDSRLKKKTDAIKKQFTRNGSGSLARFKNILNRSLERQSFETEDLLN
jgi:RNA polymerase sigma factor (sigma-70 family)